MSTAPVNLSLLRDDIRRAYDALVQQRFGSLSPRQQQHLREIDFSVERVMESINEYLANKALPDGDQTADPRYRLMYAARTPMEMILQCAYFLHINSMRKTEPLNHDQLEAVWLLERSGRKFVLEIERLWAEMRDEWAEAQQT
ncbi:MAG: hypothetical protein LCI00_15860 [Chloroflexi bacterium]|nr:hypothetical protein [Chloroflexota bacterium]MCC6892706.1 hypothetical protein [Anaerolineae bacterium]